MSKYRYGEFACIFILTACVMLFASCAGTGRNFLPDDTSEVQGFSNGRAAFRTGELWGYLDKDFNEVIPAQFKEARPFSSEAAAVKLVNKWGYIDHQGRYMVEPSFAEAGDFNEGLGPVKIGSSWGYVNPSGQVKIQPQFDKAQPFSEGAAAVRLGYRWGYVDEKGNFLVNPVFRDAGCFADKLAPVQTEALDDEWGFIDQKGAFKIPPRYDHARKFSEGLAPVLIDTKWGFVDAKGQLAINPMFEDAQPFSNGAARVRMESAKQGEGSLWGYIDHHGAVMIQARFSEASDFADGYASIVENGQTGIIDKKGRMVKPILSAAVPAITDAPRGGEAVVTVVVTDFFNKKPVPGVKINILGSQGIAKAPALTDSSGKLVWQVNPAVIDQARYIHGLNDEYRESYVAWKEAKRNNDEYLFELSLIRRDQALPEAEAATLNMVGSVEYFDILTEPVDFMRFRPDAADIVLKVNDHGWQIEEYRLQQGTTILKSDKPVFKNVQIGKMFKQGEPIYAVIRTNYRQISGFAALRLRVRENPDFPDPMKTVKPTETFSVGEVPFISNHSVGLGFPFAPVQGYYENDKFTVVFGPQAAWENGDIVNPRGLINDMKKAFANVKTARDFLKANGGNYKRMENADAWGVSVGTMGYLEFTVDEKGSFHLIGGRAIIFGSGEISVTNQFVIVVVPAFISGTVGASLSVEFAYIDQETKSIGDFFASAEITLAPFVELEAGVGVKGILAISVAGRGTIPIHYQPKTNRFGVDFTLAAEFKAVAFVFLTYSTIIKEKTWAIVPHPGVPYAIFPEGETPGDPFDMASFSPEPRLKEASRWLGNEPPPPAIGPISEQVLQSNTLQGAQPRLVRFGKKEALFWISNGPNRGANDRAVLMFAVRDVGGKFGQPKPVHDDGTNDLAFYAVAHGKTLYVAWQNSKKKFSNHDSDNDPKKELMKELCRSSEIYTARYDDRWIVGSKTFKDIARLTNDEVYDGRPCLASDGETLGIVWSVNDANDYFGVSGTNFLRYAVYESGSWKKDTLLEKNKPLVAFDAAIVNGKPGAAVVEDTDGNLHTINDRILTICSPKKWYNLVHEKDVLGNPMLATHNGQTAVFWFQSGNLLSYSKPFGTNGEFKKVFDIPIPSLTDDYDLLLSPDGQVKGILWVDSEKNLGSDAYAGFYNAKADNWGEPVRLTISGTPDGLMRVEAPHGYLDDDGSTYLVFRRVEFSKDKPHKRVKDDLCLASISPSIDLALDENAIKGDFAPQEPGKNYGFKFKAANHGTLACEGIKLEVLGPDQRVAAQKQFSEKLLPGQALEFKGEYPVPTPLTTHSFSIRVSPLKGKDAGNSSKTASFKIGIPEIRVDRVSIRREEGYRVHQVRVANKNYVNIPQDVNLQIREGSDSGRLLLEKNLGGFKPLETKSFEYREKTDDKDPSYDHKRFYIVRCNASLPGFEGTLDDEMAAVEINPFRLNPMSPSIQLAEGGSGGTIMVNVAVKNNHPAKRTGMLVIDLIDSEGNLKSNHSQGIELGSLESGRAVHVFTVPDDPETYKVRAHMLDQSLETISSFSSSLAPDMDEEAVVMGRE